MLKTDNIEFVVILSVVVLFSISVMVSSAQAAPMTQKTIGIILETSLQKSGKLTYHDVMYLDRSNKFVSGDIIDGKRSCAKVKNALSWYGLNRPNNLTVIVDPCFNQRTYMPHIIIVNKLDHYLTTDQRTVKEIRNNTDMKPVKDLRVTSHTRSVDDKCDVAILGYSKNWKNNLHDTINYLSHGCHPDHTKIITQSYETRTVTKHDIGTSAKYKLDTYYDYIKKNCTKSRNACTDLTNKAVITNQDSK